MKIEGYLFVFMAVFFAITDAVYWYTSHDPTGTAALAMAFGLATIIGSYMTVTGRRMEPRPEDRPDAEIHEGAGEIGFYSPHSWWPLALAFSVGTFAVGFVYGWWLCYIAAGAILVSLTGLLLEYYVTGQH